MQPEKNKTKHCTPEWLQYSGKENQLIKENKKELENKNFNKITENLWQQL